VSHAQDAPPPSFTSERLRLSTLFNYSFPYSGVAFLYMLVLVMYMNFATDVLGVAPGVIGMIFFISKIWDAVSDPTVGYLSDRTKSRFGRRRSWMLVSAIPIGAANVMLWAPPENLSPTLTGVWITVALLSFYTAFTIYAVPHMALGAELHTSPVERNRVFGSRQIALSIGMLLAFGLGAPLLERPESAREMGGRIAMIAGVVTAIMIVCFAWFLPRERADYSGRGAQNVFKALRDVWQNPHAKLLLFVFFIETFGMGAVSSMTPYVLKYVIKVEGVLGLVLACYIIPSILSIPVWVWLGGRFERHKLWIFAMGMSCVGYGALVFQAEGRVDVMVFVSFVTGLAQGCGATLGQAIKADVIDYDELMTGERKEGSYFATWNFVGKLATGMMIALSGFALQWAGFVKDVEQTPLVTNTIVFMMGGMPFVGFLIGMIAFSRFKLTRPEYERVRRELDARGQAQ
jgi:GPH family glycoside/pentoside/hexuronide:cation symporter